MTIKKAARLEKLPPYLFAEIDKKKREVAARGVDIISLGIGDPDLPTAPHIIEALQEASERPANHRYPDYEGLFSFRKAATDWYKKRFNVTLDPEKEAVSLIGSKEGIAHIPLAFVNPGDVVLVPDPGYPVYNIGTLFSGGESYFMPLRKENGFLPDLKAIPEAIANRAALMWIGYPNNPTAAVASKEFFTEVIRFAEKHNIIICHDNAYSEVYYEGKKTLSFLEVDGAKEVGIEFHSLSKTYNMTGWRIGFAVGNVTLIDGLGKIKTNVDSGVFQAVQEAGIAALSGDQSVVEAMRRVCQERRDILVRSLQEIGLACTPPQATFYVWAEAPNGYTSAGFTSKILDETGVVATPGNGFGAAGEGYIRFSLTVDTERLREAVARLQKLRF
ncbi:MAG: LL-diaminopimelate aminotransferase [Candidatus Binatia bacterium]